MDSIAEILEKSIKNNTRDELTGLLTYNSKYFLQVLEGTYSNLTDRYSVISKDSRHSDVELISFDSIDERVFLDWAMVGIGLNELDNKEKAYLSNKYGTEDGDVKIPSDPQLAYSLLFHVYHYLHQLKEMDSL